MAYQYQQQNMGGYPQGQMGGYPQGQMGGVYPQGQMGGYPQGQMGGYPSHAPMVQQPSHMMQPQPYPPPPSQPQLGGKSQMSTMVGKLKIGSFVVAMLAMALCAAGHDLNEFCNIEYQYVTVNYPDPKFHPCSAELKTEACPAIWGAKTSMSFIIIAWLFSIASLVVAVVASSNQNSTLSKIDAFGHIAAALLAILAVILDIWWILSTILHFDCHKSEKTLYDGSTQTKSDQELKNCKKIILSTVSEEDFRQPQPTYNYQRPSATGIGLLDRFVQGPAGPGQPPFPCKIYTPANAPKEIGLRGYLWILGGLFAIVYAVLCIVIFLQLKKGLNRSTGMGAMASSPSQGPMMSQHPSQMALQQQNPDQGVVQPDPSKQTQQEQQ